MKSKRYYFTGLFLTGLSLPVFVLYAMLMTAGSFFIKKDSEIEGFITSPFFLAFVCCSIIVMPVFLFWKFNKLQELDKAEALTIDLMRWIIALLMFFYGFEKIVSNFFDYTYRTMDTRVADVQSFELTWYYFGKSNLQVLFIGLLELVPALLILYRKTYFTGLLLLLPVAGNVLWTNIFNRVSGLTYVVSFIIMLLCFYILYSKKSEITRFLKQFSEDKPKSDTTGFAFNMILKYLTIFSIISFTGLSIYRKLSYKTDIMALKTGAFELAELEINGKQIVPKAGDAYYKTIYLESQPRWNAIVDFSPTYNPRWITIQWGEKNDSVVTHIKEQNSIENDDVQYETEFRGLYSFTDSSLVVAGIQQSDTIHAIYKRKDITKNKWFW